MNTNEPNPKDDQIQNLELSNLKKLVEDASYSTFSREFELPEEDNNEEMFFSMNIHEIAENKDRHNTNQY
jgi:hypothetical protein